MSLCVQRKPLQKAVHVADIVTTLSSVGNELSGQDEFICSEDELSELCGFWMELLKLNHWNIALRIARESEFYTKSAMGECTYSIASGSAVISILDPVDYPNNSAFKQDMEKTLVHELLHLHMANFDLTDENTIERDFLERAVNTLATSFVELKRLKLSEIEEENSD